MQLPRHVTTERLALRPLTEDDRDEFVRVHRVSDEHFQPWHPLLEPGTTWDSHFEHQLARANRGFQIGNETRLVGETADGHIAGFFNLFQIMAGVFQNAYAGWSISADQINNGLATEGMWGLLDLAFAPPPHGLGLHRVQANVIPRNIASRRVAEKLAMREEGTAIRYLKIAGEWEDHIMYAKLTEEHERRYLP